MNPTSRFLFWPTLAAVLAAAALVLLVADLEPQVESDFFFSTDDPQFQASRRIGELFPQSPQILLSAAGENPFSEDYLERLRGLSNELATIPGVVTIHSLTHGPASPKGVPNSPIWRRLLLGSNPHVSQLILGLEAEAGKELVEQVEATVENHSSPSFSVRISGVPYVVELIRRHLSRDLRVFSTASLVVFGLLIALVYRSTRIVIGTLVSCLGGCAVSLALLHILQKPIGLLTANLVTIVFVLTLSHIVFLTASWRREMAAGRNDAVAQAVRTTFTASFWCMLTTLLGFSSLLLASARPLRELGFAGALGTVVAMAVAYGLYPGFLPRERQVDSLSEPRPFPLTPGGKTVAVVVVLTAIAATGLPSINTDPPLLSYFDEKSGIRPGLELIDENGGSSPLYFVLVDPAGGRLDTGEARQNMARFQEEIDQDPAVGSSLSLSVLLDEARRVPLARFLSWKQLVNLLDSPAYDSIASNFITKDRTRSLFFLRLRETATNSSRFRVEPRRSVIDRLQRKAQESGFEVELTGGLYQLQAELGALVAKSLTRGLTGLFGLFLVIAAWVSRELWTTLAMVTSLLIVPLLVLGLFGHLGLPVDIISSPAANVAIALGIDAMIHLVMAVRRRRAQGDERATAWRSARDELWQPITGAVLILAGGFGIFAGSSFPPTGRFGMAVALGTLSAGWVALSVLPWLASGRQRGDLA
jgi:predicted RND superfamily exporter protein